MYNNYYNKNCCVEVELNTPEIEIDLEMGAKGDKGDAGASEWGDIGGTLSNQTDLQDALDDKQDTLVSGTNIKTINNESILGSGNINIQGGSGSSTWGSITGTLSDQADLQTVLNAKANTSSIPTKVSQLTNDSGYLTSETDPVFNASVAKNITSTDITNWNNKSTFSGSYNDLTNKPTIPVVPTNISSFTNDSNYQNATQVQTAINNAIGTALNGSY